MSEERTEERTETHSCDLIDREAAIDAMSETLKRVFPEHRQIAEKCLNVLPSAQPERVWTPCDIPPEHHRDVIVRGIEAIGGKCVYKVMQWDVDTWRPTDYAPSITWNDWSEI